MALTVCADCGNEVSDAAASCPNCGAPVDLEASAAVAAAIEEHEKLEEERGFFQYVLLFINLAAILALYYFWVEVAKLTHYLHNTSWGKYALLLTIVFVGGGLFFLVFRFVVRKCRKLGWQTQSTYYILLGVYFLGLTLLGVLGIFFFPAFYALCLKVAMLGLGLHIVAIHWRKILAVLAILWVLGKISDRK